MKNIADRENYIADIQARIILKSIENKLIIDSNTKVQLLNQIKKACLKINNFKDEGILM